MLTLTPPLIVARTPSFWPRRARACTA